MKRRGKGFWKEGKERKDKIFLCEKNKENQRGKKKKKKRGGSNLIDQKREREFLWTKEERKIKGVLSGRI